MLVVRFPGAGVGTGDGEVDAAADAYDVGWRGCLSDVVFGPSPVAIPPRPRPRPRYRPLPLPRPRPLPRPLPRCEDGAASIWEVGCGSRLRDRRERFGSGERSSGGECDNGICREGWDCGRNAELASFF